MSRVAKNPVKLPAGVEIKLAGQQLSIKGAKGALELKVHPSVEVIQDSGELRFAARNGDQQTRAMAGTTRALVNNMVVGVSQGFERKLQAGRRWLQSAGQGPSAVPVPRLLPSG